MNKSTKLLETLDQPGRRRTGKAVLVMTLAMTLFWAGVPNSFGHTLDLRTARDKAREYARQKRDDPNRNYAHYQTDCVAKYPGHNHVVVCAISFDTAANSKIASKEWSCSETIEVYYLAHVKRLGDPDKVFYSVFVRHTSFKEC